jgi:hypothetical protein
MPRALRSTRHRHHLEVDGGAALDVRQPREHDLIGSTFTIAGFGTRFEATVLWRVLGQNGDILGEGVVKGVGSWA